MVGIRDDGNGTYMVDIQKKLVRRWGWLIVLLGLGGTSGGGVLLGEALGLVNLSKTSAVEIEGIKDDLSRMSSRFDSVDRELKENREELRAELRSLRDLIERLHFERNEG